jgi:hypothetical protein
MRGLALACAALLCAAHPLRAEGLQDVPCGTLHFRIAGADADAACRAAELSDTEVRWREELMVATSPAGIYVVSRAIPVSGHTHMLPIKPRRAAEASGLRAIEDWGEEMQIEGYRTHAFTAEPPSGEVRLRCLAFVRNPAPTGGAQPQIVGTFCTLPGVAIDESAASEILQTIEAN